jgi:hypothetical protein
MSSVIAAVEMIEVEMIDVEIVDVAAATVVAAGAANGPITRPKIARTGSRRRSKDRIFISYNRTICPGWEEGSVNVFA